MLLLPLYLLPRASLQSALLKLPRLGRCAFRGWRSFCDPSKTVDGLRGPAVSQGTDTLTQAILDAHGKPGDMAHIYSMRNLFFVPSKYDAALRAAVVSSFSTIGCFLAKHSLLLTGRTASFRGSRRRRAAHLHGRGGARPGHPPYNARGGHHRRAAAALGRPAPPPHCRAGPRRRTRSSRGPPRRRRSATARRRCGWRGRR